ncbi:hypothetical protein X762_10925 [Mesorhizobium sp. LSHC426A00]|nr:hypothetical protein X762_10925 [Mesorhizobium sp. LSHC426A00]ESX55696.1 hypothetical protein X761_14080 [Mesorhizobium sp. LSHC424B00]ESX70514.1 hypothetical protein X758_16835 [Mesorhizobium sp. LSHC416B00]
MKGPYRLQIPSLGCAMNLNEDKRKLPKLGDHATSGQLGEASVEVAVLELGQLYERRSGLDFGVDGVIELVTDGSVKQASGRQVAVQVKRGLSIVVPTRYGRTLYCTEQHANYWLGHSLPVIVVHCEPETNRLRWQHVSSDTLRHTANGYAIDLPEQSDLHTALESLRLIARTRSSAAIAAKETLRLLYSLEKGVLAPEDELGLTALAFSRAALRGETCEIEIQIDGEADLIGSIDAIADVSSPTPEQIKQAIVRKDILANYRKTASRLRRVLMLLLAEPTISTEFGYQDDLLAEAIRFAAPPFAAQQNARGDTYLQAWPGPYLQNPVVGFFAPAGSLEDFYARDPHNRSLLSMGNLGGVTVGELGNRVVVTRFLPTLARVLVSFADMNGLQDNAVMEKIGLPPTLWLTGPG